MKKILSYLLIVYILTLTLMPCLDKEVHSGAGIHEMINPGQPANDDDDHKDCCSPLCTCSCCSLSIETAKIFLVTLDFQQQKTLVFFYNPQIVSHYLFSIWEPPKA